jgi:hypothetical protein
VTDAPAARKLLLTFSNPSDLSREAEYHEWYTQTHIPQLLEHVTGFKTARRYRVDNDELPFKYLVIYEIEGATADVLNEIPQRGAEGKLTRSPELQTYPPPLIVVADPVDEAPFSE